MEVKPAAISGDVVNLHVRITGARFHTPWAQPSTTTDHTRSLAPVTAVRTAAATRTPRPRRMPRVDCAHSTRTETTGPSRNASTHQCVTCVPVISNDPPITNVVIASTAKLSAYRL